MFPAPTPNLLAGGRGGEEKAFNPRLQVGSADEYVELMNGLDLPRPRMIDGAVPAELRLGVRP